MKKIIKLFTGSLKNNRTNYLIVGLLVSVFSANAQTFVNQLATGANDGTSWANAYTDLHTALFNTTSGEIWVAKGTYTPSKSFTGNIPANNSQKTFRVKNNVQVYGGFNGDETSLAQRDWVNNATILSGNLGSNVFAFNVVRFDANDNTTVLDGFTIRDGKANGTAVNEQLGGAIYIANASKPTIRNCKFVNNNALQHGGAIYGTGGAVKVEKCIFESNTTTQYDAGALYLTSADSNIIVNCLFNGNTAARYAGAVVVQNTPMSRIINCTFVKNTRGASGSGKCVFLSANTGNPQLKIENCIFSNNYPYAGDDVSRNGTSGYTVANTYCDAGSAGFTLAVTLTNIITGIINFTDFSQNDFTLQCNSPAVNTGNSNALYIPSTDLLGNTRVFGSSVDLGAFENNVSEIGIVANRTTICAGESVTLKGTCDPSGYTWSNGVTNGVAFYPTTTATYTCTGLSTNDTEVITVNVLEFNNDTVFAPQFVCSGSSANVTLGNSIIGGNYFLVDTATNFIVDGPIAGTGSAINFTVSGITSTKTYKVIGSKTAATEIPTGLSLDFDGSNDKVITDFKFNSTNTFSVEGWILPRANAYRRIFSNYTSGVGASGEIAFDTYNQGANNGKALRLYIVINGVASQVGAANVLTLNTWNFVAATFDNGVMKLYVNGNLVASANATGSTFVTSAANAAYGFGEEPVTGVGSEFFDGKMDEFRFWNKALTAGEISSNMTNCVAGNEAGLLAYFKFEEGTGSSTITDIVGGYTGTLTSMDAATDWVSGIEEKCGSVLSDVEPLGKSLDFDGTNDRVATSFGLTSNTPAFSIEAWLYPRSTNYDRIISNYIGSSSTGSDVVVVDSYDATANNGKALRLLIGTNIISAPNVLTTNTWNHIAAVFDNGTMSIYVNGFEVANGSANINAIVGSNLKFYFGEDNAGADNENLNGKLDEVRFWSKALTQTDIMNNMYNCLAGSEANLMAYYNFEDGAGEIVSDLTVNEKHGVFVNMDAATDWVSGVYTCETNCTFEMSDLVTLSPANAVSDTISVSICAGSTYTTPLGSNITTTSTVVETLVAQNGCDSTLTINVNVIDSVYTSNVDICEGDVYTSPQGATISSDSTIVETYTSVGGCDSTVTIVVTVNALTSVSINNPGGIVCNTNTGFALTTTPSNATFLGNAVVNGIFYPSNLPLGNNEIIATYTSNLGCTVTDTVIFNVIDCTGSDDLFACYNLNGNLTESINQLDGSGTNGVTATIGHLSENNGAISIAGGAGQIININNTNTNAIVDASIADGITISAWIKPSSFMQNSQGVIVSKWNNTLAGDQFILMFDGNSGGRFLWAVGNGSNSATGIYSSTVGINTTSWTHVTATWEPGGMHKIYVNGILSASNNLTTFSSILLNGNATLSIGAQHATFRNFYGAIDDIRMYGKAINANDVNALYLNSPTCPNITGKESVSNMSSFALYPNPSNNNVTFELGYENAAQVEFYSLDGKVVISTNVSNAETVNIENLNTGIYLVKIKSDSKSETIKFVKQ